MPRRFFFSKLDVESLKGKFVFIDSDFLGILFDSKEVLQETVTFFPGFLLVDPRVRFEFLRDVFLPKQRELKEKFVANQSLFQIAPDHQEIYKQLEPNALLLSQIYKHQNTFALSSMVDLLLVARIMIYPEKSVLITGNKRDFPSQIFNTLTILSYECNDGSIKSFSVLQFDRNKFESCRSNLEELERRAVS